MTVRLGYSRAMKGWALWASAAALAASAGCSLDRMGQAVTNLQQDAGSDVRMDLDAPAGDVAVEPPDAVLDATLDVGEDVALEVGPDGNPDVVDAEPDADADVDAQVDAQPCDQEETFSAVADGVIVPELTGGNLNCNASLSFTLEDVIAVNLNDRGRGLLRFALSAEVREAFKAGLVSEVSCIQEML